MRRVLRPGAPTLRQACLTWLARAASIGCLAVSGCAVTYVSSPVHKDQARYIAGTTATGLSASPSRLAALKVSGPIRTDAPTEFIVDAGRDGRLAIPYDAITALIYGPAFASRAPTGQDRWTVKASGRKYPWATGSHRYDSHFLKIVFRDRSGLEQDVVLGLGADVRRPVLEALERRSGCPIQFEVPDACLEFRTADACGYGQPSDLKGLTKIFVDTAGSREWTDGESLLRIIAAIADARLGLEIVSQPEADVVLAFAMRLDRSRSGSVD